MVRASENSQEWLFYSSWYFRWNGTIAIFLLRDLFSNFHDQTFQLLFWPMKAEKRKSYYCNEIGPQLFALCEWCTSWTWPIFFSRPRILICKNSNPSLYLSSNYPTDTARNLSFIFDSTLICSKHFIFIQCLQQSHPWPSSHQAHSRYQNNIGYCYFSYTL